jgi:hypothetical protein
MLPRPAVITAISVENLEKFSVRLHDGREIVVPVEYFPSIEVLSLEERQRWILLDEQVFSFETCDEVFHLREILGFASGAIIPALEYAH